MNVPTSLHACGWPLCGCDPTGTDSPPCRADHANEQEEAAEKTRRNARVQARFDDLMREGKHGHYETMFRVMHEEVERAEQHAYVEGRKDEREVWEPVARMAYEALESCGGSEDSYKGAVQWYDDFLVEAAYSSLAAALGEKP